MSHLGLLEYKCNNYQAQPQITTQLFVVLGDDSSKGLEIWTKIDQENFLEEGGDASRD